MSEAPNRPQPGGIEQLPAIRGSRLIALIFVLWLPLPIILLGVLAWVGLSLPLLGIVAIGTVLSLGLAIGAARIR